MMHCTTCRMLFSDKAQSCPTDKVALHYVADLEPGMIVRGKYEAGSLIGKGGMGVVYRAKHLLLQEPRALKVLLTKYSDDQDLLSRFQREALVTRKLFHENAVRVEDLEPLEDGRPFISMELLEGKTLRDVIAAEAPLPIERAALIAAQVASALNAAHKLGITHRDIKPDNIFMVTNAAGEETAKVLDFGIAKVKEGALELTKYKPTTTGIIVGTPYYISPEQAKGELGDQLDGRADIYSLGAVLYEMLTARTPFTAPSTMEMILRHLDTKPTPPHKVVQIKIPRAISAIVMKCLEKKREDRFQGAADVAQALRKAVPAAFVPRPKSTPASVSAATVVLAKAELPAPSHSGSRHGWKIAIAAALVLALGSWIAWSVWGMRTTTNDSTSSPVKNTLATPTPSATPAQATVTSTPDSSGSIALPTPTLASSSGAAISQPTTAASPSSGSSNH